MATHFNTQRIHISRDLLLSDILIFVKIIKEMILCVALWNASAEGTCSHLPQVCLLIHVYFSTCVMVDLTVVFGIY